MERIDNIVRNGLFLYHLKENKAAEADRCFCRHDMVHFLDVARIGMLMNLEEEYHIPGEQIYAAALLHDIGKHFQYENGTPHEQAGCEIAPEILKACGFSEEERTIICDAIRSHRDGNVAGERSLRGLLYRADKASRPCYACEVSHLCKWSGRKKNTGVKY